MAKILIVDDEASIRRTLRDILEYEKYEVDETRDGMECLVKLKKEKLIKLWNIHYLLSEKCHQI